jgi:hypothetical protein
MPDTLANEREALNLSLIHSSLMLTFNLRSRIDLLCREGRLQVAPDDLLKLPSHQMASLMQIAIQTVLGDEIVKKRIEQDPDFGQIIYDALYYPTRRWHENKEKLDCRRDELINGMIALISKRNPEDARGYAAALTEEDSKDFLYGQVRKLLHLVCNRNQLQAQAKGSGSGVGCGAGYALPQYACLPRSRPA